jgi:membrane-bound ClpP family serine protease
MTVAHGFAHLTIPVHVHGWQYGYSGVVILLLPILGTIAIFRGSITAGLWLLTLSGLAAFIFEGLFHFVVASPDHVASVTSGRTLFWSTAVLTTIGDAVLTVVVGWLLAQRLRARRRWQFDPSVTRE